MQRVGCSPGKPTGVIRPGNLCQGPEEPLGPPLTLIADEVRRQHLDACREIGIELPRSNLFG